MSTTYIPQRDDPSVTRQQLIEKYGHKLYISDDDISEGKSIDTASDLGVDTGSGYIWLSMWEDKVTSSTDYGVYNSGGHDVFASDFNLNLVSEHEDEFSYHQFPVDVKDDSVVPFKTINGWDMYVVGDWVYPYNRTKDIFVMGDSRKLVDDFDWAGFADMLTDNYISD